MTKVYFKSYVLSRDTRLTINEISVNLNRNDEVIVAYSTLDLDSSANEPVDGETGAGLMVIVYPERPG
jgi:hypothetical protein